MEMKLELVAIPVSDVDRAKTFYVEKVGFHADHAVESIGVFLIRARQKPLKVHV